MKIIKPENKYLESYLEGCKATWETVHEKYIIHDPDKFDEWKNDIFKDFQNAEKGIDLPEGFIKNVTYWMVNDTEYIGTINIRLELTPFLARYGGHAGLVIQPKFRGNKYSITAVKFIFEETKKRNIRPLLLATQENNAEIIHLLEKFNPDRMEKEQIIHNGKELSIRRYYFE